MGVLLDKGKLWSLRTPLSNSTALHLLPSESPAPRIAVSVAAQHEIESLNLESAARARRWLVGEKSLLAILQAQVGNTQLPAC
jgi:hypothetical protein